MIIFVFGLVLLVWMFIAFAHALRTPATVVASTQTGQRLDENKLVYFDRERELEDQRSAGEIDSDTYERLHAENARLLLADARAQKTELKTAWRVSRLPLPLLIALFIVLGSFGLYHWLGAWPAVMHWQKLTVDTQSGPALAQQGKVEDMMLLLRSRLHDDPEDADGWIMLGRSWLSLEQPALAVQAFNRARALEPKNADYWVAYAQALRASDNSAPQKVDEALRQALLLNPEHEGARLFSAYRMLEKREFASAIALFEQLKAKYADNPEASNALEQALRRARAAQAESFTTAVAVKTAGPRSDRQIDTASSATPIDAAAIQVTVTATPELLKSFPTTSRVFIYAKALQGSPMPLAIIDTTLDQLPLTVTLSDAQAMAGAKLSQQQDVLVVARASRSGLAKAQDGDWEATAELKNWRENPAVALRIQAAR